MPACCSSAVAPAIAKGTSLVIALAGNPNSGKTTVFNALTGLRQHVGNYPGITVERKVGQVALPGGAVAQVIDVPGTYSLISRSPDEHVAMEVLRGLRPDTPAPDIIVVVVDASNLQRNLYLVSQIIELGRPMVVALNMMDIAARRGIYISTEALSRELGVPVIPIIGHRRTGIAELKQAIAHATVAPMPDWPIPQDMKEELTLVGGGLAILDSSEGIEAESVGLKRCQAHCTGPDQQRLDRYYAIAERLLTGDPAPDLAAIARREPVKSLLASAGARMTQLGIDAMQTEIEAHYRWIEGVAHRCAQSNPDSPPTSADTSSPAPQPHHGATWTDRADGILVHRFWGLLIFALIMMALFISIFWLAAPIQAAVQSSIHWLGHAITARLADGPIKALLSDGIFAGVGAVVVFVPQIAMLFAFLSILEDSGYLARAAFLMDRLLAKVGLHGKSFIPLLSSFACAIPGIMATRTIENRKDRLATILVAPFMSCSARLPIYTLLISAFFATRGALFQAGIMLGLYAMGIIAAAGMAWIFRRTLLRGPTAAFILEFPTYKLPQASQVARQVWTNTSEFLKKAGTLIFCMSVILWAMTYYPRLPQQRIDHIQATATGMRDTSGGPHSSAPTGRDSSDPAGRDSSAQGNALASDLSQTAIALKGRYDFAPPGAAQAAPPEHVQQDLAAAQREYSIAGRVGHAIEPVIRPLGYDWKIGVGLIGAFAAREVFVSTLAITYAAEDPQSSGTVSLAQAMRNDRHPDGTPVWTALIGVSVLVWFVLAMQCMSTIAVIRRETQTWRWPLFMLAYMNVLAYVACLLIYQIGSRL